MSRQEFDKATMRLGWKRCGGRCEGMVEQPDGKPSIRCNAVLAPGRINYDHVNPDGLTGKPTLENMAVLCLLCHAIKTGKDVKSIAKAKRLADREADIEARKVARMQAPVRAPAPAQNKASKPTEKATLPRRSFYEDIAP